MSVQTAVIAARCRALSSSVSSARGAGLAPVLPQANHLAVHDIGQDCPELLALAALNLVEPEMRRPSLRAGAIPVGEKRFLGAPRLAPADTVAHRGMTGRHRLAIDADLLPQAPRDARFGSANSRRSVRIPQRRQSTRRWRYTSVTGRAAHGRSSPVRSRADRTRRVRRPQLLHGSRRGPRRSIRIYIRPVAAVSSPSTRSTRNPGSPRIHVQSRRDPTRPPWLVAQQERTTPGGAKWDRTSRSGSPSRPPIPSAVRAGGRVLPQIAVLKSVNRRI